MVDEAFEAAIAKQGKKVKVKARGSSLMPLASPPKDEESSMFATTSDSTSLPALSATEQPQPTQVITRLDPAIATQLKAMAVQMGVSRDALVEAMVRQGLEGDKAALELQARAIHQQRTQLKELRKMKAIAQKLQDMGES